MQYAWVIWKLYGTFQPIEIPYQQQWAWIIWEWYGSWCLATHSNPIKAAECLDGNAMGWCQIRRSSIVVGFGFGMEQSHTIPIVDAMENVWGSAKYVEIP